MTTWFYADHNQQRRGPVTDEQMRVAYQQRQIVDSNLVWTQGMPDWQPLSSVAAQLGINVATSPPPMPFGTTLPIYADPNVFVVAKRSNGIGIWVIVAIIAVVVGLAFIGILAAIAIPAYSDYSIRARLNGVISEARSQRIVVDEFYLVNQSCPKTSDMNFSFSSRSPGANLVQAREMDNHADGSCALIYTFTGSAVPGQTVRTLTQIRSGDGQWHIESTLPARYLPSSMRDTTE